jgi:CheY-like chemotaxis protein
MRVLLVDDDRGVIEVLSRALRSEAIDVVIARTSRSALAAIERAHFDAVVLDLQMPLMDGRDFYRTMRGLPRDLPVLVLEGRASEESQLALGPAAAATKPFELDRILSEVRQLAESRATPS